MEKAQARKLDQKFTENINPIMMAVNNMQNARFGKRWSEVRQYRKEILQYLEAIEEVCDAHEAVEQ